MAKIEKIKKIFLKKIWLKLKIYKNKNNWKNIKKIIIWKISSLKSIFF